VEAFSEVIVGNKRRELDKISDSAERETILRKQLIVVRKTNNVLARSIFPENQVCLLKNFTEFSKLPINHRQSPSKSISPRLQVLLITD
jgi:hypothetical protein